MFATIPNFCNMRGPTLGVMLGKAFFQLSLIPSPSLLIIFLILYVEDRSLLSPSTFYVDVRDQTQVTGLMHPHQQPPLLSLETESYQVFLADFVLLLRFRVQYTVSRDSGFPFFSPFGYKENCPQVVSPLGKLSKEIYSTLSILKLLRRD